MMEIKILENTKKKAIFQVKGIDHTLSNLLREQLNSIEGIKISGYHVSHPLVGIPQFVIETNGKISASDAFTEAIKNAQKDIKKFKTAFQKVVK
jgi:DNA-directed RNA polymerase subunit L